MQTLINFFRGSAEVTVTGAFPERFLNLCGQQRLAFWGLVWVDECTLQLHFSRSSARRLAPLAQRTGCTLSPAVSAGVPAFLSRFKARYALMTGLALWVTAACVLSQFIFTVEIIGNERVSTSEILNELSRHGVRPGAYGPGLDRRDAGHQVLLALPELSFLSINLRGTRAEVVVREGDPKPDVVDEGVTADVVAGTTGLITHLEVLVGQPKVAVGDTVLKGEVLISGVVDIPEPEYGTVDLGVRFVHAQGRIIARTWRTFEAALPAHAQVKAYTGGHTVHRAVIVLGRRMNFYGNSSISYAEYDKISEAVPLTLPGGLVLPVTFVRETYRPYQTTPLPVDATAAQSLLRDSLLTALDHTLGDTGQVARTDWRTEEAGGLITVTLLAECVEEIGVSTGTT